MRLEELKNKLMEDKDFINSLKPVRRYIPVLEKSVIAKNIVQDSMQIDDNGLAIINLLQKDIMLPITILMSYYGIEIDELTKKEDVIALVDFLYEHDLLMSLTLSIKKDVDELYVYIEQEIENIKLTHNSIQAVLARGLNGIIRAMPSDKEIRKLTKEMIKEVNKMDWNKVPMLKEMYDFAMGKTGGKNGKNIQ